ncbi:MAG: hypothetical protein AB2535_20485 [Candidatus Thiodiazotropha endolucinida]
MKHPEQLRGVWKINYMKVKSILSALCPVSVFAGEVPGVNDYVRVGVIEIGDQAGDSSDGSALGGKLGYIMSDWQGLTLGLMHANFDGGTNETDYYAIYESGEDLVFELIYTDLHEEGISCV